MDHHHLPVDFARLGIGVGLRFAGARGFVGVIIHGDFIDGQGITVSDYRCVEVYRYRGMLGSPRGPVSLGPSYR